MPATAALTLVCAVGAPGLSGRRGVEGDMLGRRDGRDSIHGLVAAADERDSLHGFQAAADRQGMSC